MKFKEGDRAVTCGRTTGFHLYGYFFATKVYEARVRKKDGALVWKLVGSYNEIPCGDRRIRGDFPSPAAIKLARVHAKEEGLPFVADLKDNQTIAETKVPRSQAKFRRPPRGNRLERISNYVEGQRNGVEEA